MEKCYKMNPKWQAAVDVVVDLSKEIERRTSEIAVGKISLEQWHKLGKRYTAARDDLYSAYSSLVREAAFVAGCPVLPTARPGIVWAWVRENYGIVDFTAEQLQPSYWMRSTSVNDTASTVKSKEPDAVQKLMLEGIFVEECKEFMCNYASKYTYVSRRTISSLVDDFREYLNSAAHDAYLPASPRAFRFTNLNRIQVMSVDNPDYFIYTVSLP